MNRRLLLISGLVIVLAAVPITAILISPLPCIVRGWIAGESFHDNLPSRYWIDALAHADPKVRQRAAHALGRIGPKAEHAVPALCMALDDKNQQVRWAAAGALGEISKNPDVTVPALERMMLRESSGDKVYAVQALGFFGTNAKAAIPKLIEALDDESGNVRRLAAWTLGRMGPDAKAAIPKLMSRIQDNERTERQPASTVGEMACAALWAIDANAAREAGVPRVEFRWNRGGMDNLR